MGAWNDGGTGSTVIVQSENGGFGGVEAAEGDHYLALQQAAYVSQQFHTTKNGFYVLSFEVAARPDTGMDTLEISVDGVLQHQVVTSDTAFSKMSYLFAAESELMTVMLAHNNDSGEDRTVFLDDVKFVAYDEASSGDNQVSC